MRRNNAITGAKINFGFFVEFMMRYLESRNAAVEVKSDQCLIRKVFSASTHRDLYCCIISYDYEV